MFKESSYNLYMDMDDQRVIAINTTTTATIVLTREVVDRLTTAAAEGRLDQLPLLWRCQLLRLGFIVPAELDELAAMCAVSTYARYATHGLGLTICPTMACNLACTYCYQSEERRDQSMDRDTADAVVRFAGAQLPESSVLHVHWYGGEPLLRRELLCDLTERLRNQAVRSGSDFRMSIVTNGTLLDQSTIDFLESHHLESIQVTLDGPQALHDRRKPMNGGQGSFDMIVGNLARIRTHRAQIAIRINVDDTNVEAIPELIGYIREALPHCSVYVAPVLPGFATCSDVTDHCIDNKAFADLEYPLLQRMWANGLSGEQRPFHARSYHCGASSIRSYTIDPKGQLYKCWHYPGNPEHSVGHVALPVDVGRSAFWLNHSPYLVQQCRQCKFLPLCNGGCVYQTLVQDNRLCDRRKYYLRERLLRRLQIVTQPGEGGQA